MIGFRILSAIAGLTAIALVAGAARAGPKVDPSCADNPGSMENCAPLVGCLGSTGINFTGRVISWNHGSFAGNSTAGFSCNGQ